MPKINLAINKRNDYTLIVGKTKKEVNIMFELVQSQDFVSWLSLIERHRPAMFARASAEELVEMYGGKLSSHQLTTW